MSRLPVPLGLAVIIVLAAACTDRTGPTEIGSAEVSLSKSANSTTYGYTFAGDFESAPNAAFATMRTNDPFTGLEIADITITLTVPSGNISACNQKGYPYADNFGDNEGVWRGSLSIKRQTYALNFLGTRVGGTDRLQFTTQDLTGGAVMTRHADGSYTFEYTDAVQFQDTRTTLYDGKYRCMNFVVTARP